MEPADRSGAASPECRRFVVVSHLRSGTHLLRTALESHPAVVCQTEVFNSDSPNLPYPLDTPTGEVLARWVFRPLRPAVSRVGFVIQAYHPFGLKAFPGIRENPAWGDVWSLLEAMTDLRVIHLRRENGLRRHLSQVMARATGAWHAWDPGRVETVSHLKPPGPTDTVDRDRAAVTLDPQRLEVDFQETHRLHDAVARRFAAHAYHALTYEELCRNFAGATAAVQAFLEVPVVPLQAAVSKLEQRPLADAIANYEALRRHFAGTPWAPYFDE